MSLLEQDTIRETQVDKNNATKLDASNNNSKKYKIEIIYNNVVYIKESKNYLSKLYYLVF